MTTGLAAATDQADRRTAVADASGYLAPIRNVGVYFAVCLFAGFCLLPLYVMITTALKRDEDIFAWPPLWQFTPTLEHVRNAFFGGLSIVPYLVNSLVITLVSTLGAVLLGAMAAYGLARFSFRGNDQLAFWILSTRMAPPIAFIVPLFLLARDLGLQDTHVALILIYTAMNLSFVIWVLGSFFREIPIEIEEAALVDGYSRWQVFWRVALPIVRPGLAATAICSAIFAWNEFIYAMVLTSKRAATIPKYFSGFSDSMTIAWGEFMAVGCFAVLPIMIFTLVLQRHLVRGLTFGAVK